ncbi:MAG: ABC transporter permease [Betaproteobacteria bacterium]|nr:ABC transporter permease [Betaproteobacteria bacterium]
MQHIRTLAYYTLLEARRTRLPWLLGVALAVLVALAFFAAELAVIESTRLWLSVYAAGARWIAVFIVCAHVLGSITREFNDKGIDALLALDLPRPHFILGKLAGFLAIGTLVALAACVPLVLATAPAALLQWGLALTLELAVMAAFSLFCVMAFAQFIPAAALVLAFYVLARTLSAIQLISAHPVSGGDTLSHMAGRYLVDALALVMPALDRWPQTAWLIDAPASWLSLAMLSMQAALYVALLAGAAMVDFQRRNF